jgi:type 1 glutamine amidotransferase
MKCLVILFMLLPMVVLSQLGKSNNKPLKIIVFSKTIGYRHESIPKGIETLKELAAENGWEIFATEDSTEFTSSNLKKFNLIIFLSVGGHILNHEEQKAIEQFVESGKGLLAIHTGAFAEPDWKWYHQAIGTSFVGHPPFQKAKVIIEDRTHPSTKCFPDSIWETGDEWYSFTSNPRKDVHVLASIDENSYNVDDNQWFKGAVQRMGDHPLVWYRKMGKGMVYQTAFGHSNEKFSDPVFRKHLVGAIEWTAEPKEQ